MRKTPGYKVFTAMFDGRLLNSLWTSYINIETNECVW